MAYKQMQVEPSDKDRNTIKTPFGTFKSRVMLQGDINTLNTIHQWFNSLFYKYLGRWMEYFFNDMFILDSTLAYQHIWHIW